MRTNKAIAITLLVIGVGYGCKRPQNASQTSSLLVDAKYAAFIRDTFTSPRAQLNCETVQTAATVTTFPNETNSYFIEFAPVTSVLNENCYIAISADIKPGKENQVKWLASGPTGQHYLFISSMEKVTTGNVVNNVHIAHYYQTFDIAADTNAAPAASSTK